MYMYVCRLFLIHVPYFRTYHIAEGNIFVVEQYIQFVNLIFVVPACTGKGSRVKVASFVVNIRGPVFNHEKP